MQAKENTSPQQQLEGANTHKYYSKNNDLDTNIVKVLY